jgi:hypothetical protein
MAAEDNSLVLVSPAADAHEFTALEPRIALLTLVALKWDRRESDPPWRADLPTEMWPGVSVTKSGIVLNVDLGTPRLSKSLHLRDFGPSILTPRLCVLKLVLSPKVKGHLASLSACTGLTTLVLNETGIKGSLKDLECMSHLRRLNLSRTKVIGTVARSCDLDPMTLECCRAYLRWHSSWNLILFSRA